MKSIALFGIESKLYVKVDVAGLHGRGIDVRQDLQDDHIVDLKITSFYDGILTNQTVVRTDKVSFSINIRKGKGEWFRIDNAHGYLHIDILRDKDNFTKKVPLPETMRISELISLALKHAKEILKNDFGYKIVGSDGFLGSACIREINDRGIVTDVKLNGVNLKNKK